jgi:hypothetical protein
MKCNIKNHPRYRDFVDEDPARKYLNLGDMAQEFARWVAKEGEN